MKENYFNKRYGMIVSPKREYNNIGDEIMLLSLKQMYERMGIAWNEIIKIGFRELCSYNGEMVLLPVAFPLYGYNEKNMLTCWSDKITPIFLSVAVCQYDLHDKDIEYFKKYEPVGCRDGFTYTVLKRYGINVYLNGCMSLTLKKPDVERYSENIYFIDVYEEFLEFVPNEIRKNALRASSLTTDYVDAAYAEKVFEKYYRDAKLIITSRLHCALPCIAYGIPVIFIHDIFDQRFTWLENIITVYTPELWSSIDWSGTYNSVNGLSMKMLENAVYRAGQYPDYSKKLVMEINEYFQLRQQRPFVLNFLHAFYKYVSRNWNRGG